MDTNSNNLNGVPLEEELQQIANAYFSATPSEGLGASPQQYANISVVQNQYPQSVIEIPSAGTNPLQSASSADFSHTANAPTLQQTNVDYQSLIPGNSNVGYGNLPNSEAGSGISPSYVQNDHQGFDIYEPQNSLPDPHFKDGIIPSSVAGSGASPSVAKSEKHLPLASDTSFESELKDVLNEIVSFIPSSQLPFGSSASVNESAFYFIAGTNYFNQANDFKNPFGTKNNMAGIAKPPFDVNLIKQDFPILQTKVNGKEIVWLDNAATTQKPKQVIERVSYFYEHENSNIHRAAHELAARATDAYEAARQKVSSFINASSVNEIVFVRGTTEGINLVAESWGDQYLKPGDEIIVSHLEHHANIVPWQILAKKKGLTLKVIPVDDDGQIILEEYGKLLTSKTKLVSFTQVSNALGTVTPAKQIIEMAHWNGAKVLLDGAQSVSHIKTDVQYLDADFFVFSGHKVFGPTGIGVLYGKEEILNNLQPYQGGGNMIKDVTFEHTEYHNAPSRFEAGTGNIADAVGLGAAIDYVNKIGINLIAQYEHALLEYGTAALKTVPGIRLVGTAKDKTSVMSFVLNGYTNEKVGQALNKDGIAVRTGHHCAQPILRRFGLESTVRPSLAFYNTCSDIDRLVAVLHQLKPAK